MGTFHIPLDGIHSAVADGGHHAVVIIAVGRSEQVGAVAGDSFDFVVAGVQLGADLVGAKLGEIRMIVRMVHDLMPGIVQGLHRLGELIHPLAYHKKGGFDVVFSKNVDELLGVLVTPGGCQSAVGVAVC